MDFSEAAANGFHRAYVDFRRETGDKRSKKVLLDCAKDLLKGCYEHYRASITRMGKQQAIVPPTQSSKFRKLADSLVKIEDEDEFNQVLEEIQKTFPLVRSWLHWWLRPSVARKIFHVYKTMPDHLWDSMPRTNNPQEALHFRFYASTGKFHPALEGFRYLFALADNFEKLYQYAACT